MDCVLSAHASPFFRLPREIRDQIYEIVLANTCVWFSEQTLRFHLAQKSCMLGSTGFCSDYFSKCNRGEGKQLAWIYACKQMLDEAVAHVYRHAPCDMYEVVDCATPSLAFAFVKVQRLRLKLRLELDVGVVAETGKKPGVVRPGGVSHRYRPCLDNNVEKIVEYMQTLDQCSLRKLDLTVAFTGGYPGSYWALTAPYIATSDLDGWEVDLSFLKDLKSKFESVTISIESIRISWEDDMTVKAIISALPLLQGELARRAKALVRGKGYNIKDRPAANGSAWFLEVSSSHAVCDSRLKHTGLQGYHESRGPDEVYWKLLPDQQDGVVRFRALEEEPPEQGDAWLDSATMESGPEKHFLVP